MKMLTTEEAATYLLGKGAKPDTLAQWRYRGEGPTYCKIGSLVRYSQSDLDDFLKESTRDRKVLKGPKVYRTPD